ncbi:hypothetical protein [Azohydromonas aeria]|uniref:hypothetical protein n=1 Tax=Azohydromonas aeria TaxID=2590212 RepID=UPI0012F913E3|nr:hypothetical protein [Azohydromonas aeria]
MERTYWLSVLRRHDNPGRFNIPGTVSVLVLRVTVAQPLEWVRAHADEIAQRAHPEPYCALWLDMQPPEGVKLGA